MEKLVPVREQPEALGAAEGLERARPSLVRIQVNVPEPSRTVIQRRGSAWSVCKTPTAAVETQRVTQ